MREFNQPYSLIRSTSFDETWFGLHHNDTLISSYSVKNWGSEQACIDAAWNHAYQPDPTLSVQAVEALAAYQQADEEGIMVLVSRQAIEECLPTLWSILEEKQNDPS